jgi:hypothetical protein
MDGDRTRDEVVETLTRIVDLLGWRIRKGDGEHFIVLLPPLARSNPDRNRWKDEPEEGFESKLRGRLGELRASDD